MAFIKKNNLKFSHKILIMKILNLFNAKKIRIEFSGKYYLFIAFLLFSV